MIKLLFWSFKLAFHQQNFSTIIHSRHFFRLTLRPFPVHFLPFCTSMPPVFISQPLSLSLWFKFSPFVRAAWFGGVSRLSKPFSTYVNIFSICYHVKRNESTAKSCTHLYNIQLNFESFIFCYCCFFFIFGLFFIFASSASYFELRVCFRSIFYPFVFFFVLVSYFPSLIDVCVYTLYTSHQRIFIL